MGLVAILLFLILPVLAYTGNGDTSVYVTDTGGRYHVFSCGYLRKSRIEIALEDAVIRGYTRCTVCWPPQYTGTAKPGDPKPVSDSSGSFGSSDSKDKISLDLSKYEDWEMPSFKPLPTIEETNRSSSQTKGGVPQRDTADKEDRSEYRPLFWAGSFLITLFAFGHAINLSEHFHSDVIYPYTISCAAPFISILGCIIFKWSPFVFIIVLVVSIVIFSANSAIYMKKYRKQQSTLRKEAKENGRTS